MKLKIKNENLKSVADFLLNEVPASGKKNINRMRVYNALNEKNEKIGEEEVHLLKEYAKTDDEGGFIRKDNGNIDFNDIEGFKEQQSALLEEYFIIDDVNMQSALKSTQKLVDNHDKKLQGESAQAHFILVTAFEDTEDKEENDTEDTKEED